MPNQAKIMKGGIVLSAALVALLFRSSPVMADDWFQLQATHSQKCAQVNGGSQNDGQAITQWQCVAQPNVNWSKVDAGNGFFFLQAQHSRKCAIVFHHRDDSSGFNEANGTGIGQWDCQNSDNFLWSQQDAGGGSFFIVNKLSNKCMQVDGASNDNGARISQWDCVDQPNVKWRLTPVGQRIDQ